MGKATDFKFGQYIQRVHPNKIPLNILEKRERGRIQGLPNFFRVPPIISGTAKAAIFKFCTHIYRLNWNKSRLKISGKAWALSGTPENSQGTHAYGASRGHLCDSSAFLFLQRVSIARYAKRCTSYRKSVRPSVCLSVCLSDAGTVSKRLQLRSWGLHWRIAP